MALKSQLKLIKILTKKLLHIFIFVVTSSHFLENGLTPVELLFNRKIRSSLPIWPIFSIRQYTYPVFQSERNYEHKMKRNYNQRTKELSKLGGNKNASITKLMEELSQN